MANFLLIYRADPAAMASMPAPTPEQVDQMNTAWMGWRDRVGAGVVDFGNPTVPVSDGADATVGGYSIIEAENRDAALELLNGHPHRASGGTIDVYEITPFPMG